MFYISKHLDICKEKKDSVSVNKNTKKNVIHFSPNQSEKSDNQFLQHVQSINICILVGAERRPRWPPSISNQSYDGTASIFQLYTIHITILLVPLLPKRGTAIVQ